MGYRLLPPVLLGGLLLAGMSVHAQDDATDPSRDDAKIVEILDKAEHAGTALHSLHAGVVYLQVDDLLDERVTRTGELIYLHPAGEARTIGILFESLLTAGRRRSHRKHYIFTRRWLVERDFEAKLYSRRTLADTGSDADPFELGKGPFPLPIGQSRQSVLEHFSVRMVPLPPDGPLGRIQRPVDGLELIPLKTGEKGYDFRAMQVFYDRTLHVPVGIRLVEHNGDIKAIRLDNIIIKSTISPALEERVRTDVPSAEEGWNVDIQ